MSLPSRSIQRPVAVAMFFAAVVFLGLISFFRLPIDLLPDIAYPKLVVYTSHANVAPAEVERFVTEPIERNVAAVPGVERIESVSREGISLVTLRFAWGADMDFAALNVREKLDNLRDVLPERASRPVVLRTDPTSEPIMALSVTGSDDLWALKEMAEAVFKRRLEQVDGIAQAAVTGGLEREIHVEVDPERMEALGITMNDVELALQAANASAPGGTVRRGRFRYSLRTLGELSTLEEIASVPIRPSRRGEGAGAAGRGGGDPGATSGVAAITAMVRLSDIAKVQDAFQDRQSIARYNGAESIGMLLFKEAGSNTVRVAEEVDAVLEELRAEYPAIQLEVAMSQASFISEAIANVVDALVQGGLLAFLVLFLFLRDVRYPIGIAIAIPISVVATFALLDAVGISLNIMTLGGLALGVGMLVDNSIVVLENIFRHREKGLGAAAAAAVGTEEVVGAVTSATLTTIAVFGPIIYIEGVAGELFGALSFAVAFSLLASLLVAVMLLPVMASKWDDDAAAVAERGLIRRLLHRVGGALGRVFRPVLDGFDRGFRRFADGYDRSLAYSLDHRAGVVILSLILLGATLLVVPRLSRSVLPEVDQGAFQARVELPRGTPIEETAEAAVRLEALFREDPDVEAVFSRIGRQAAIAGLEEEESGLNTALLEVQLRPDGRTARVIERVRPRLEAFTAGTITLETGQATALGHLLGGGEADLAVRIRGDDLDSSLDFARHVEARLAAEPALTNVRLGMELGQPEVQLEIDRERAAAFGIEPWRIAETVEKYMLGARATELVEFDRKVPVVVLLPREARHSLSTLDVLRVEGVPLREVVRAREAVGPVEIRRTEQSRVVPVYADAVGRDVGAAIAATQTAVAGLDAPRGTRVEIGGENEEMQRNFRELGLAFTLAILLVYMILAAKFESFIHPFTILLSVPLAVVGGVFALWIAGAGINSMSLIAVIILVGIANNDAIIMLDFILQAGRRGLARREAILEAGRARLRPILMTTVTTLFGVLPMAIGLGRGADLRQPLAITVFGGLVSATLLTLIVIPVVYDLIEDARARIRALVPGFEADAGVAVPALTGGPGADRAAEPAAERTPVASESRRP